MMDEFNDQKSDAATMPPFRNRSPALRILSVRRRRRHYAAATETTRLRNLV
jgi:hypothetical protein